MKTYPKLFATLLLAGLTVATSNNAFARRSFQGRGGAQMYAPKQNSVNLIEYLTEILAETDTPLTGEQITALQGIEQGPESRQAVKNILTEEQHDILVAANLERRQGKGRDGREGRGGREGFRAYGLNHEAHIERIEQILEEAGMGLTPDQVTALEAIEFDPESRGMLHEILTDEQIEALRASIFENRQGRGLENRQGRGLENRQGRGRGGSDGFRAYGIKREAHIEHIGQILDDAGKPLTPRQKEQLAALKPGPESRGMVQEILTDEQCEALRASMPGSRPGRGRNRKNSGEFQSPYYNESPEDGAMGSQKSTLALHRNYPNPFNPSTTIRFDTLESGYVTLDIYNIEGQRVRTLVDNHVSAGTHSAVWNGTNERGQQVSAGQYFYTLKAGNEIVTEKMLFTK